MQHIHKIFNPESIAVIGATDRQESVGYAVLHNLLTMDYTGEIYPINPKKSEILDTPAFPSLDVIENDIDLGVIATPARSVPDIVRQCGQKGMQSLVIISSGFSEIGEEGKLLEQEIQEIIGEYDMSVIGPNCLGVMNPWIKMNASFAGKMPYLGKVGFISQSGALCTSILDWAIEHRIGFSNFVSVGSMMDLEFADLIDYFDQDEKTESIILYIESIKKPEKFIEAARRFTRNKPIFAIKAGRFEEGSQAAASHTGALAGSNEVYEAALERAGVIRVHRVEDLINVSQSLSMQQMPQGNRLCIITNAGGPGVITTDSLVEKGGKLAEISPQTTQKLNEVLPPFWSHGNPVDVLGDARADRYEKAFEVCMKDKDSDGVMVIFTPQAMSEPVHTARSISRISKKYKKPVFTSWMGAEYVAEGVRILIKNGIPSYPTPESAIDAFTLMYRYNQLNKELSEAEQSDNHSPLAIKHEEIARFRQLIAESKSKGESALNETQAKELLEVYGLPTSRNYLAITSEEAAQKAQDIGYPVVLKIQSPEILHKTDAGGVLLNLKNAQEVKAGFQKIAENAKDYNPQAQIEGVTVQKMINLRDGHELLLGMNKDPVWGASIVFGAGGVNVERLKDTSISLLPLNRKLVQRLIGKTKISGILGDYRGQKGVNIKNLEDIILNFARLIEDFPEISELDINPLLVKEDQAYILDARIIF